MHVFHLSIFDKLLRTIQSINTPYASENKILELKLSVEDYLNSINLFENEWFNKINIPENTNSLIYFVLSRLQSDFFDLN